MLAFIFSPSDLRFAVDFFGTVSPVERAKGMAVASALHQHITEAEVDDACSEATLWSLIKGKTYLQMVWSRNGLEPYVIQPEAFGVYNESISSLERQEAFVHSTFPTRSRFAQIISSLPVKRQVELMRAVDNVQVRTREGEDHNNFLKQVIVGGSVSLHHWRLPGANQWRHGDVPVRTAAEHGSWRCRFSCADG